MKNAELIWMEKLEHFSTALAGLREARQVVVNDEDAEEKVDSLLRDGVIYRFADAYRLALDTMTAYEAMEGEEDKDDKAVVEKALALHLVSSRQWLNMVEESAHGKNVDAQMLFERILVTYVPLMERFEEQMQARIKPL